MDSDDEDTFVTVGSALPPYEEDEAPKKPVSIQDQAVRDTKGRQRFHGAFTGGFSAGYFNSVGSKEGWTPSTFVSSREKKAEKPERGQLPEDFMDEDDLGEHGIAPRKLTTTEDFTSAAQLARKRKAGSEAGNIIPGGAVLEQLIVAAKASIGARLLRNMGWKEGQGIGPRRKRKTKTKKSGVKVYGCALPGSGSDQESEESDDEYASGLTFAPKDVTPINFEAKDDVHGIGYQGIDPRSALPSSHINLFEAPVVSSTGRKGMSGRAFGVGAFEDEDDDIYATDHMSNYDRTLEGPDKNSTHGWTAPKRKGPSRFSPAEYVGTLLEGFMLSTKQCEPKKIFRPPDLPRDYRPFHKFSSEDIESQQKSSALAAATSDSKKMTSGTRGFLLGEQSSVFDLVSKSDKEKMESAKLVDRGKDENKEEEPSTSSSSFKPFKLGKADTKLKDPTAPLFQSPTGSGTKQGSGFKPFANDPTKEARYEKYLELKKQGKSYESESLGNQDMTEWEKEREKEEFARASQIFRPMSFMMASRFTHAKFQDTDDTVEVKLKEEGEISDKTKAAEMKMFGKLTREKFEWHPDRVLCKRFNIPDPYPQSNVVGLPSVKRDKYSVFNFLSVPTETETSRGQEISGTEQTTPKAIEYTESSKDVKESLPRQGILSTPLEPATKGAAVSETHNQEGEDTAADGEQRPSMDLFKAIFADSETSSDSSGDEDEDKDTIQDEAMDTHETADEPKAQTPKDNILHEARTPDIQESQTPRALPRDDAVREEDDAIVITEDKHDPVVLTDVREGQKDEGQSASSSYGPALPPIVISDSDGNSSGSPSPADAAVKSKSHRKHKTKRKAKHKDKHKHKKKKKKSKQKHKKSKKKTDRERPSSSSDEYVTEESDQEAEPADARMADRALLQRLKNLPKDKRLRAADFL